VATTGIWMFVAIIDYRNMNNIF